VSCTPRTLAHKQARLTLLGIVSRRLSLWYVLATEDDPDERFYPIDNYSIRRRYELTLAKWERQGRRWNGHVDMHAEFLRMAQARDAAGGLEAYRALKEGKAAGRTRKQATQEEREDVMVVVVAEDDKQEEQEEEEGGDEDEADKHLRRRKAKGSKKDNSMNKLDYPIPTRKPRSQENCHHCKVRKEYWLYCPLVPKHRYAFAHSSSVRMLTRWLTTTSKVLPPVCIQTLWSRVR